MFKKSFCRWLLEQRLPMSHPVYEGIQHKEKKTFPERNDHEHQVTKRTRKQQVSVPKVDSGNEEGGDCF